MRALTPSATSLTHFATVDLAVGAWPEVLECQERTSALDP